MPMIRVLFAPDWRSGVGYQGLLAAALAAHDVTVEWLNGYRRILPLARSVPGYGCDLLHLHWPEAYYSPRGDLLDPFRNMRFPADLLLATRRLPFVVTAHNLYAHNRSDEKAARYNARFCFRRANAIFAHSQAAKDRVVQVHGIDPGKVTVIPAGDLAQSGFVPVEQSPAREKLGLSAGKICLMFGTVEPYKGIEEMIYRWADLRPEADLYIVGRPVSQEYGNRIQALAGSITRAHTKLTWLSDEELCLWLSAADCTVFNYQNILTSGAALLARSMGIPILIPSRLSTLDLMEPDPRVFRFDWSNFASRLDEALRTCTSWESAARWRESTNWDRIAEVTAEIYRNVLERRD